MDKLYTIIEVAAKLNLSDKTLRRWEEAGRFTPSRTLGNQRRYSLDDLQILDAIKHGTINEQKDLLTVEQAGKLCGVSTSTILRWENDGRIHPLITSGNTYYPRHKLMEKMDELKTQYPESVTQVAIPVATGSDLEGRVQPAESTAGRSDPKVKLREILPNLQKFNPNLKIALANILITLILLASYHLLFNQRSSDPVSPQAGLVQGVATTSLDPRLDDLIAKFQDHLSSEMLKDAKPATLTTINLDNTALVYGSASLPKNQSLVKVEQDKVTPSTPITVTFTSDYAPAKKYWVTASQGSFTVSTDFPVSSDSTFNYNFLTPTSTVSAIKN